MFHATMTFNQNLDFPYNFLRRNEIVPHFLINIDLQPHTKFHENAIKKLREQTI